MSGPESSREQEAAAPPSVGTAGGAAGAFGSAALMLHKMLGLLYIKKKTKKKTYDVTTVLMCCFEQLTAGGAVVLQIFFFVCLFCQHVAQPVVRDPGIFFFFLTIEDFSNVCISCSFDKLKKIFCLKFSCRLIGRFFLFFFLTQLIRPIREKNGVQIFL